MTASADDDARRHLERAARERIMATRSIHPLAHLAHTNLAAMHERAAAEIGHTASGGIGHTASAGIAHAAARREHG